VCFRTSGPRGRSFRVGARLQSSLPGGQLTALAGRLLLTALGSPGWGRHEMTDRCPDDPTKRSRNRNDLWQRRCTTVTFGQQKCLISKTRRSYIVASIVGEVPIVSIEADTMRQKLHSGRYSRSIARHVVRCCKFVRTRDSGVLNQVSADTLLLANWQHLHSKAEFPSSSRWLPPSSRKSW
jgi:hypothetical protein